MQLQHLVLKTNGGLLSTVKKKASNYFYFYIDFLWQLPRFSVRKYINSHIKT